MNLNVPRSLGGKPVDVSPYTVLIWDFDGVVANTEPVQASAYERVLADLGIETKQGFFADLVGRTEPEIWRRLRPEYQVARTIPDLVAMRESVYLSMATALQPNGFVKPLADDAKTAGIPMIIVSSGNHEMIVTLLAAWGLEGVFDQILAHGSPGLPADSTKQARLTRAVLEYGLPCLVIEDNLSYAQMAKELGADTIGIDHELSAIGQSDVDYFWTAN